MSMPALRIPVRAIFYREDSQWYAHCLEFDLVGSGATREEALTSLSSAMGIQIEDFLAHGNPANLFSPADGRLFQMFAAADDSTLAHDQLEMRVGSVVIERVELREFSGAPDQSLVPAS